MTKKTIHIEAIDTLFFRDGKPFSMGEDVWADGIFPPLPSVIYGALRSAYMFQKGLSVKDLEKETENFRITNIYLLLGNEQLEFSPAFPFPADLIKPEETKEISFLEPVSFTTSSSTCKYVLAVPHKLAKKKTEDLFGTSCLLQDDFKKYLKYDLEDVDAFKLSEYITNEPKIGIARSNETHTTSGEAEGKMYRVSMQRLENKKGNSLKIAVEYENLTLNDTGIIRLGGENKSVFYKHIDQNQTPNIHLKTENLKSDILRVYLNTPAILENGYCPKIFLNSNDFELLTYAIGKPLFAGGFDMAKKEPKPMYKAVPAGSVYYLKAKNPHQVFEHLYQNNPFDEIEGFAEQGFGKFYIGTSSSN